MLARTHRHHSTPSIRPHRLLALAALACLPLAACGSDGGSADTVRSEEGTAGNDASTVPATDVTTPATTTPAADAIATVVYQFHDASVPPEYHRSYTVTVTEGSATVVVDSYGDIIDQATEPIDAAAWAATVDLTASYAGTESTEHPGCTGGTAEELTALDAGGAEVLHVYLDHCGESSGTDLQVAVGSVLSLFDLATMTATS